MALPVPAEVLDPLISRIITSHCWLKRNGSMKHLTVPLTESRILQHLTGTHAYGVAQIAPGTSTARVALLDFDSHKGEVSWSEMQAVALGVIDALEEHNLHPVPFRSSGGSGIHLFLLWDTPQDAYSVRTLLKEILESVGYASGVGGVAKNQVEIFPKQNSVPEDGFGNMFVLPLAGQSIPLDCLELEPLLPTEISWTISDNVPLVERMCEPPAPPKQNGDASLIANAIAAIPDTGDELDYEQWRNAIFAIHYETGGSPEGLALAHEFSAKFQKYNPEILENTLWPNIKDTYDGENGPITGRTLFKLAAEYGWEEPFDDFEAEVDGTDTDAKESVAPVPSSPLFLLAEDRAQAPIKPDLIQGVIPDADFGIVYGAPGAGKSFAVIDLAYHLARGMPWRGRKSKQRNIFYVATEGALGVRRRTAAYAIHHELSPGVPFYTCESLINLHAKKAWRAAADAILAIQGEAPGVIIVDTLSRSIPGVDENSAKDMSQVISNCYAFGKAANCMMIVIAHAGKDSEKGVRGSSVLRAAADFELSVTRYLDTELRCIKLTKSKDDIDGVQFPFKLTSIEIGKNTDGDNVFSAVAIPSEEAIPEQKENKTADENLAQLVENTYFLLAENTDDGRVDVEKLIDQVLAIRPNDSPNRRRMIRRHIEGARKIEMFNVVEGFVSYGSKKI